MDFFFRSIRALIFIIVGKRRKDNFVGKKKSQHLQFFVDFIILRNCWNFCSTVPINLLCIAWKANLQKIFQKCITDVEKYSRHERKKEEYRFTWFVWKQDTYALFATNWLRWWNSWFCCFSKKEEEVDRKQIVGISFS